MNCLTCRQQLQPFLDDELSVRDNVAVLEHVTACAACQEVFHVERRIWETVRGNLLRETCPEEAGERLMAAVRTEARGSWKRRWPWLAVPLATAAAIVLGFRLFPDAPPRVTPPAGPEGGRVPARITFAAERKHDHSMHGELLAWAGARYDELVKALPNGEVLTAGNLASVKAPGRSMAPIKEFEQTVKDELGSDFKLPPGFVEGGRIVGGELLSWHEGWVPQVIVEYGDRELALYEISGCQAKKLGCAVTKLMPSLHPVESDQGRQVSISACRGCDAILVLRNNRAYILVSRHGRDWDDDWMLQRARRLLD
jgi:hypothetical protein